MATSDQIAEQVQFERDAIKQGLKRLRDNTKRLEESSYASASVYGISSIDTLLPLVTERIQSTTNFINKGRAGQSFREIKEYLKDVEPLAAAAIALKVTFDKVFSAKEDSNKLVKVCESIGQAIEQECQMRYYERVCPGLLRIIKDNYWHRACGTQQKLVVVRTLINRSDIEVWQTWSQTIRAKLGGWLLTCVIEESGWFTKSTERKGKRTENYVEPTPEFMAIKDQIMDTAELFSPIAYPMLIEPNDWTNERQGGYLLNEVMRGHNMVRGSNVSPIQGETPINFLNRIQKVGYVLNPFTIMVAEQLYKNGITVGKFIPIVEYDLPNKPYDIDTNKEARQGYKRECAEVYNLRADSFKRSCRTRMTMEAVKLFKDKKEFFIPWSFDYRGRAYPIPAFLTPQDTDFGKSLLKFSRESLMVPHAEEWLAFQVATTYGLDKAPIHERLQWVSDNYSLITKVATDPIANISEWESADEPWQFLAACDEYYHCVIYCDRNYTSLPVATDATCSGLQILAGLCRDAGTASLVNVLPGERPADAYRTVAEHAKPNIPERWRDHVDRGVAKRLVMTIPYNAKFKSNWNYVNKALNDPKEKGGKDLSVPKEDVTAITHALRDSVFELFPGPTSVMKWIEEEVSKAIKRGDKQIQWCTPSGFVVTQNIMKKLYERVTLQLLGRVNMRVSTEDSTDADIIKHKAATAPNLIHSLDASLLHLSALKFEAPIALIHDSVLCRATDMGSLSSIVRETYMHLFADHDFLESWSKQIGAETDPPMINTLEAESVIESTYFFC